MGLSPDTFWNLTLVEWRAALAGYAERRGWRMKMPADGLSRSELSHLMQLYPDTRPNG